MQESSDDVPVDNNTEEKPAVLKPRPNLRAKHGLLAGTGGEEWMLTYMDVVTLLVTLFVILMSFSEIKDGKFTQMAEGISSSFGNKDAARRRAEKKVLPVSAMDAVGPSQNESKKDPKKLKARSIGDDLSHELSTQGISKLVTLRAEKNNVSLQINEKLLFAPGMANLKGEGVNILNLLVPVLKRYPHLIIVEGHTDKTPIATDRYPSNWELSSARASVVVRHFLKNGFLANRFRAVGYADTKPVATNKTFEGRAKNRRVRLRIQEDK